MILQVAKRIANIRFDPNQASPLLQLWKAISGAEVLSVWSDTDSGNRAALVFAII